MSRFREHASTYDCDGDQVIAITAMPEGSCRRGIVVIVGGPQYRVGSHRQFQRLSHMLAAHDIAVMRFDVRGMGDSEGSMRSFLDLDTDIRFAVDHFVSQRPDLEEIVLWGLCDGASAALFYAHQDPRVKGLVLLNPWVRTEQGRAQANVQSYYLQRLLSPDFWGKVVGGRFNPLKSGRDLFADAIAATGLTRRAQTGSADGDCEAVSLPQRMLDDWIRFRGPILLILSGNDLTADEFRQLVARDKNWKRAVADSRVERVEVSGANHTFASGAWREQVERATAKWITSW